MTAVTEIRDVGQHIRAAVGHDAEYQPVTWDEVAYKEGERISKFSYLQYAI